MVRDPRKVRRNLLRKGFVEVQCAKHIYYHFELDGVSTEIRTFMSRNKQDLNDYLIGEMSGHVRLGKKDFIGLIDCPLSEEDYIKILKDKGLIQE